MNPTEKKEFSRIKEWIDSGTYYSYPVINEEEESYFQSYTNSEIYELDFSNIKELKEMLAKRKQVVQSDTADLICSVEVFKHKPEIDLQKDTSMNRKELPGYVYVF